MSEAIKVKKTFKQLRDFDVMVSQMYKENPELEKTKFGYAVKRFNEKNYIPHLKDYRTDIENAHIDNALTDSTTQAVLLDKESGRGFSYSKDGLKAVIKDEERIMSEWDKKEFEIETYQCKELPELTEEQRELFTGILI